MSLGEARRQDADGDAPPAWALSYAEAALRCGMKAPDIEANLILKGLPRAIAESVVPYYFERRIHQVNRSQMWADRRRLCSRSASLVIATGYLVLASFGRGLEGILCTILFLLTPLGCIWFPEIFGTFFRRIWLVGPYITDPTPAGWIVFAGWFILLSPVLYVIVSFITIMMIK
jgi:hypothetical protein